MLTFSTFDFFPFRTIMKRMFNETNRTEALQLVPCTSGRINSPAKSRGESLQLKFHPRTSFRVARYLQSEWKQGESPLSLIIGLARLPPARCPKYKWRRSHFQLRCPEFLAPKVISFLVISEEGTSFLRPWQIKPPSLLTWPITRWMMGTGQQQFRCARYHKLISRGEETELLDSQRYKRMVNSVRLVGEKRIIRSRRKRKFLLRFDWESRFT